MQPICMVPRSIYEVRKGLGKMKAIRFIVLVCCISLLITSCGGSLDPGDIGYVTMMPYVNEGMGIRSVVPLNWIETSAGEFQRRESELDQTTLILAKIPEMSLEEAKSFAASQLGLDELPSSLGNYTSPTLTWELYEFESMMGGLINLKFMLAMASDEVDVYAVLMAGLEVEFVYEAPFHETIFIHVIHGLSPLE